MTERRDDRARISRRQALTGTALVLGAASAAALARPAAAQQKISQAIAMYQDKPHGNDHCGACANFVAPNTCRFVQGAVNPSGWCQLFAPKG